MKAGFAEVRSNRRGEFQRGTKKLFLQRLAVRRVIAWLSSRIVKQQGLIMFPTIIVFGRQNFPVSRGLPIGVFLFFHHHAKRIASARVGVKIQVISEYLGEPHGQFRRFPALLHGVEQ